jgi:hypothetical protein
VFHLDFGTIFQQTLSQQSEYSNLKMIRLIWSAERLHNLIGNVKNLRRFKVIVDSIVSTIATDIEVGWHSTFGLATFGRISSKFFLTYSNKNRHWLIFFNLVWTAHSGCCAFIATADQVFVPSFFSKQLYVSSYSFAIRITIYVVVTIVGNHWKMLLKKYKI